MTVNYIKKAILSLFIGLSAVTAQASLFSPFFTQEERWDWSVADTSFDALFPFFNTLSRDLKRQFKRPFMWGVATSDWQISGEQTARGELVTNNWSEWVIKKGKVPAGIACDHWNRYKEDTQLIKQFGLKFHRLSVDWSKIEPQQGIFDLDAMNHYIDEIDELRAYGIEPIVCLFHQTWPLWFDKKGAFEKEENIESFVEFAQYVFEKLHDKVKIWMTLNEPIAYAMSTHFIGTCPPGNVFFIQPLGNIRMAGVVFKNFLNSHVAIYQLFKQQDPEAFIGFTDVFTPVDPYHPWHPLEQMVSRYFDSLLHDVTLNFFKTGVYNWMGLVKDTNPKAPESLDYLGVNYYTHKLINLISFQDVRPEEKLSSKGTSIYPEGLYRSLKRAATLGKPIIIGENGIADTEDTRKDEYIRRHLYATQKACQEIPDLNVIGYFYWTLIDSFGWNSGFDRKYGFYRVDFDKQSPTYLQRTLRDGAKPFSNFIHKFNS